MRQTTKDGLAILAGDMRPDAKVQCLLDWIKKAYGGAPINIGVHSSDKGVLGTLSVTYHRDEDSPEFRSGYPKYVSDAQKIYDQALACGVISADTVLSAGFTVRGISMQRDLSDAIVSKVCGEQLKDIEAQIANPDVFMLLYSFGWVRVFFATDSLRDKYKCDEPFLAHCRDVLHKAIKAQDPDAYVTNLPGVSVESEQELRERYDGNLFHYFK